MKQQFIKKIFFVLALTSVLSSCKKMLETDPKNSLDLTFALSTREGLQATLVSIYNALQASTYYGRDFIVIPELLADNTEITSNNSNRFVTQGNNTPGSHINIWAQAYRNINRANLIISNIDASAASATEKTTWKGEAYFLRALFYSDLIRTYARAPLFPNSGPPGPFNLGVPIIKDPVVDATTITFPARSTVAEVYDFIIADLVTANSLLSNGTNAYRPRKVAAQALASRMELYRGNWAQAERWADSVLIQNVVPLAPASTYFNLTASGPGWGNAHPETIFALMFVTGEGTPGTDALQYIYYRNLPAVQGYADITMQQSLRNDMQVVGTGTGPYTSVDQRFTKLVSVQVKSSQTVFYTMKWPGLRATTGQDDIIILRTSEVVLNRAEARARQGKEALAIADLNLTRVRAGLTAFPTSGAGAPTGAALIAEILKERRIELAFEGHRLFDVLRTGGDVIKSPSNIAFGSTAYNYLIANILQADLDVNTNLVKNPGY